MDETEQFLADVMPRLVAAETAIHNGDVAPRLAMWSQQEPITLFGAFYTSHGWPDVSATFQHLATMFRDCSSYEVELVAAGASGDLAYMVAIEHTTASLRGAPPEAYRLRVTHVFRREDGEWKIVHRHGDRPPDDSP